ncbi:Uncharacterised protein [Shigella sonnei]|nr:Uncharacterised protein [Shigella sonnei]
MPELVIQRLIQPQLLTHQFYNLRISFEPGNQSRRIAGQHMHK